MIGVWQIVGSFIFVCVLIGGSITALKGRWAWFFIGMATGGIIWPLTATILAKPGSPWAETFYAADMKAKARRAFPPKPAR